MAFRLQIQTEPIGDRCIIMLYIQLVQRRFPDFSYITESGRSLTEHVDCLIISHFHLDHCGALPYFTEMCGYDGPIFMTHPTKAICPILLVNTLSEISAGLSTAG